MRYYAPKDQIDQVNYAMKIGSKVLPYFEKYYNVTYPLPKAGMFNNIKSVPNTSKLTHTNFRCCTFNVKRQPHKMVKHIQTIRRLMPANCLSAFEYFERLALKGLRFKILKIRYL